LGRSGKKHHAEAAGEDVVRFVGKRERLRAGFAEFDVGDAFLAREFFGKRNHARAEIGRSHTARWSNFHGNRKRGIANATGKIENAHAGAKMGGLENGFGGATGERGDLGVPFAPGGYGPVAGPFLVKMLAEVLDFCRIRRAHE